MRYWELTAWRLSMPFTCWREKHNSSLWKLSPGSSLASLWPVYPTPGEAASGTQAHTLLCKELPGKSPAYSMENSTASFLDCFNCTHLASVRGKVSIQSLHPPQRLTHLRLVATALPGTYGVAKKDSPTDPTHSGHSPWYLSSDTCTWTLCFYSPARRKNILLIYPEKTSCGPTTQEACRGATAGHQPAGPLCEHGVHQTTPSPSHSLQRSWQHSEISLSYSNALKPSKPTSSERR